MRDADTGEDDRLANVGGVGDGVDDFRLEVNRALIGG